MHSIFFVNATVKHNHILDFCLNSRKYTLINQILELQLYLWLYFHFYSVFFKVQRADLTCHVIRNLLGLCCVDQSGTSIQILPEPRDTFFL